jgi:hypothetical protein
MRAFNRAAQFAEFTPLPPTQQELEDVRLRSEKKHTTRENYIKQYNFALLNSDYLGMTEFYYDHKNDYVWELCSLLPVSQFRRPGQKEDNHIRTLNRIPISVDSYNRQPAFVEWTK